MASGLLFLFALCASLLGLTSAKTTNIVVNPSWTRTTVDGALPEPNLPVADCPTQEAIIRQAYADALSLASNAADVIGNKFQSTWHGTLFDTIFRDPKDFFSRRRVACNNTHLSPQYLG